MPTNTSSGTSQKAHQGLLVMPVLAAHQSTLTARITLVRRWNLMMGQTTKRTRQNKLKPQGQGRTTATRDKTLGKGRTEQCSTPQRKVRRPPLSQLDPLYPVDDGSVDWYTSGITMVPPVEGPLHLIESGWHRVAHLRNEEVDIRPSRLNLDMNELFVSSRIALIQEFT